jgi:hypothetical protein
MIMYNQLQSAGSDITALAAVLVDPSHALMQRSVENAKPKRAPSLALRILKSYPQMILRRETLPPFIHRFGYQSEDQDAPFAPPLENAINIVNMQYQASQDMDNTQVAVWKIISMEVTKIMEEVSD